MLSIDPYHLGMLMPGRSYSSEKYRFGFNGKENDNEVKGTGNQQDYGMRIYDPRIIRFNSVDPLTKKYPWYSPYQFAGNKFIWAVDLDGKEEFYVTDYKNAQGELYKTEIRLVSAEYKPGGQPSVLVHRSEVVVSSPTSATVTYVGSTSSPWRGDSPAPFANQNENATVSKYCGFRNDPTTGQIIPAVNPADRTPGFILIDKGLKGASFGFNNPAKDDVPHDLAGPAGDGYLQLNYPSTNGAPVDDFIPKGTNAVPKDYKERSGGKVGVAQGEQTDQVRTDNQGNTITIQGYDPDNH